MLFGSLQSKVLLALALPVIYLTQREGFNITKLLTQLLLYGSLAYNTDCLVTGSCQMWAWGSIIFPVIQTIGFLFFTNKLALYPPVRVPLPRSFSSPEQKQ